MIYTDQLFVYKRNMIKPQYDRHVTPETDEKVRFVNKRLREIGEALQPIGSKEYLCSVALHFYAGSNLLTAESTLDMASHKTGDISQQAVTLMLPEIRDRIFEMFGAQQQRLAPMTVEETKDTLGEAAVIDING